MSTILGPDGRPIDIPAVMRAIREPQTAEIGPIQTEFDRHPARGLSPAKLQNILSQAEQGDLIAQLELCDDMEERDAHLYAELGKRRGAITALAWSIEPPDKATAEEEKLAEQVRDWMGMLTCASNGVSGGFDVLLGAMTAAVLPGFAPIEKVWNLQADSTGRQVLIPHHTLRPQRWFTTSADRSRFLLRSVTKQVPGSNTNGAVLPPKMGEELQPFSWLLHVHPARAGYVTRMSLARVLFWPYLFKNYAVRDLAEFLEIYGLPLRVGKYPSGASDAEKLALLRAVTSIGHNAAGIIPQGMLLEFQAAAAGTEVPFAAMWDRMDAAESKAILGQTLSASEGQKGSHALGQVHEEVRMDIRAADAKLYESSIDAQVIAQLCALNVPGVNMRRLPRFKLDTGEAEDLQVYADNLPKLANAGLQIGVKWVHDKLRIPEPEAGEAVLKAAAPPAPAGALPGDPKADPKAAADAAAQAKARDAMTKAATQALVAALTGKAKTAVATLPPDLVDALVAEQAAQWQPLLTPMVEPLLRSIDKALAAGETLEAFAARLPELVRHMDADALTTDLARAAFSARLAGEADLNLE